MKDVAREAQVALGTVSKVINNIPVGDKNRLKVEEAISKLGYEVNTYARGLKAQKTYTVTLIVPDVVNPFFALLANYVELELFERGYKMILCDSHAQSEKELFYINMSSQNKVDGIIALTYSDISKHISVDLPIVTIDRHLNSSIPCVSSDNIKGGFMATEKLIECGCKFPAYIRTGSIYTSETNNRKIGYLEACKKHGIQPLLLELVDGDDTISCFEYFLEKTKLSDGSLGFDGIFTVNDSLCFLLLRYILSKGYKIPEDIQLIGFDGMRHFGNQDYYVSTIEQPVELIAKSCVEILLSDHNEDVPNPYILPVTYRFGGTTKL
jgi:LacI family transcriptional regulator